VPARTSVDDGKGIEKAFEDEVRRVLDWLEWLDWVISKCKEHTCHVESVGDAAGHMTRAGKSALGLSARQGAQMFLARCGGRWSPEQDMAMNPNTRRRRRGHPRHKYYASKPPCKGETQEAYTVR
jgi:hypothetical protein